MSIPIKTQLFGIEMTDGNDQRWDGLLILKDGEEFGNPYYGYSYYGQHENKMHALSRSYAGQVIKQTLKHYSAEYHDYLFQANHADKSGDVQGANWYREQAASCKEDAVVPLTKLWAKFRALKPEKPVKPDTRKTVTTPTSLDTVKNVKLTRRDFFKNLIPKK